MKKWIPQLGSDDKLHRDEEEEEKAFQTNISNISSSPIEIIDIDYQEESSKQFREHDESSRAFYAIPIRCCKCNGVLIGKSVKLNCECILGWCEVNTIRSSLSKYITANYCLLGLRQATNSNYAVWKKSIKRRVMPNLPYLFISMLCQRRLGEVSTQKILPQPTLS